MIKFLLAGDSLSMVRPEDGINFKDIFFTKVSAKFSSSLFVNGSLRSNDTENILKAHYLSEYVSPLSPDVVILQLGIVDASPRIFTKNEKLALAILAKTKIFKGLANYIIKYRSQRRYSFTKKRAITAVSLPDFIINLNNFLKVCRNHNDNVHFIVINICSPGKAMIDRNYGIINHIKNYNEFLHKFVTEHGFDEIDLFEFTKNDVDALLSDGYHITTKTHEYLSEQLVNIINSFSVKN